MSLAGALQGGGDTRTPFIARTTALFGASYALSGPLGMGVAGTYVGIVLYHVWAILVNAAGFRWGGWVQRATESPSGREVASRHPVGRPAHAGNDRRRGT